MFSSQDSGTTAALKRELGLHMKHAVNHDVWHGHRQDQIEFSWFVLALIFAASLIAGFLQFWLVGQ